MSAAQTYFVVGTDTEVGKTFACCALLHRARRAGLQALAMKPVAAGRELLGGRRINPDVAALAAAASFEMPLELLNPYAFDEAVAPHIAAAAAGVAIEPAPILAAHAELAARAEILLVEGVGGFRVPLGPHYDTAELARDIGAPLILVVGLRLGCINHALLAAEAIAARGLRLAGWIANSIDPVMPRRDENIAALGERLPAPLLGVLPHSPGGDAQGVARWLELPVREEVAPATIVLLDSAAELGAAHRGRVVITASPGGVATAAWALRARPTLVFFNDAGGGKDQAGTAALELLERAGIAAACYAHSSARLDDGRDAFGSGRVSHVNVQAQALGVRLGEPVVAAASRATIGRA